MALAEIAALDRFLFAVCTAVEVDMLGVGVEVAYMSVGEGPQVRQEVVDTMVEVYGVFTGDDDETYDVEAYVEELETDDSSRYKKPSTNVSFQKQNHGWSPETTRLREAHHGGGPG